MPKGSSIATASAAPSLAVASEIAGGSEENHAFYHLVPPFFARGDTLR